MFNLIDKALSIAVAAHAGQTDKGGDNYILHPLRLMMKFEEEDLRIVAILHDVIEDSSLSVGDLKEIGFPQDIVEAIDALTKRKGEQYEDFILRIKFNGMAKRVKIEDIKDNMNLLRIPNVDEVDLARVKKYHHALKVLSM